MTATLVGLLFAGLFAWALASLLPAGADVAARACATVLFGVGLALAILGALH